MRCVTKRFALHLTLAAGGGLLFQLGIGGCVRLAQVINPCGTILAQCTQEQLDFLVHTIPDFEYDPSCTIPGACPDGLPFGSFSGGLTGSGPGIRGNITGGSPP